LDPQSEAVADFPSWSVTALTFARITFFAISAPRPFSPEMSTLARRSFCMLSRPYTAIWRDWRSSSISSAMLDAGYADGVGVHVRRLHRLRVSRFARQVLVVIIVCEADCACVGGRHLARLFHRGKPLWLFLSPLPQQGTSKTCRCPTGGVCDQPCAPAAWLWSHGLPSSDTAPAHRSC
jgi:hypothetical protein